MGRTTRPIHHRAILWGLTVSTFPPCLKSHIFCAILVELINYALLNVSMIPVIEVSHLPSSASFYAAVCQPLSIHFLPHTSLPASLDFGLPATAAAPCEILFTLSVAPNPQKSLLKFRASSQGAVTDFHWRALQANYNSIVSTNLIKNTAEESIARITDLDGNMLEARFNRRNSAPVLSTTATPKEARRVLDWQREVANSLSDEATVPASPSARQSVPLARASSSRGQEVEQEPRLIRRETIAAPHYQPKETEATPDSRIMSNQALIGTILGAAAAGAALAYTMAKSEDPRPAEAPRPRMVSYHSSPPATYPRVREVEQSIEAMSIRSESNAGSASRKVDGPLHVIKYSGANGKVALGEIDEEKSVTHVSRRSHRSHRSRESDPSQDKDSEPKKGSSEFSKSSKHTSKSKKARDQPSEPELSESSPGRSEKKVRDDDNKSKTDSRSHSSYVSARSEASTAKPPDKEKQKPKVTTTLTISNKEALDRASEKRSVISSRDVPLPESSIHTVKASQRGSVLSARDVPLPESTYTIMSARNYPLPESHYSVAQSVAPSDSISSIGMKRERGRRRI